LHGRPDPELFDAVIGELIRTASDGTRRAVRAYGEMVSLLWDAGQVNAAIELEELWNELRTALPFSLFCSYGVAPTDAPEDIEARRRVCHLHTAVLAPEPRDAVEPVPHNRKRARAFDAETDAPREARHFAVQAIEAWGQAELVDDAALVVTELTTNAVRHARTPFTLSLSSGPGSVGVAVRDASLVLPTRYDLGPMAAAGRGLGLLTALSTRWGVEVLPEGKVVWAELGSPGLVAPGNGPR
ncbi:MAG: ATP-binding protein, partial [Acidimicrobiales bacterium]